MEPSFLRQTLDRYETSLPAQRVLIPRKFVNLWIVIRMMAIASVPTVLTGRYQVSFLGICKKVRKIYQSHYYLWLWRYRADA
jgi:hypothetical protein